MPEPFLCRRFARCARRRPAVPAHRKPLGLTVPRTLTNLAPLFGEHPARPELPLGIGGRPSSPQIPWRRSQPRLLLCPARPEVFFGNRSSLHDASTMPLSRTPLCLHDAREGGYNRLGLPAGIRPWASPSEGSKCSAEGASTPSAPCAPPRAPRPLADHPLTPATPRGSRPGANRGGDGSPRFCRSICAPTCSSPWRGMRALPDYREPAIANIPPDPRDLVRVREEAMQRLVNAATPAT